DMTDRSGDRNAVWQRGGGGAGLGRAPRPGRPGEAGGGGGGGGGGAGAGGRARRAAAGRAGGRGGGARGPARAGPPAGGEGGGAALRRGALVVLRLATHVGAQGGLHHLPGRGVQPAGEVVAVERAGQRQLLLGSGVAPRAV